MSAGNEFCGETTIAKQSTGKNDPFPFLNNKPIKDEFISIVCSYFSPQKEFIYFRYTLFLEGFRCRRCNFVIIYIFLHEIRCLKNKVDFLRNESVLPILMYYHKSYFFLKKKIVKVFWVIFHIIKIVQIN